MPLPLLALVDPLWQQYPQRLSRLCYWPGEGIAAVQLFASLPYTPPSGPSTPSTRTVFTPSPPTPPIANILVANKSVATPPQSPRPSSLASRPHPSAFRLLHPCAPSPFSSTASPSSASPPSPRKNFQIFFIFALDKSTLIFGLKMMVVNFCQKAARFCKFPATFCQKMFKNRQKRSFLEIAMSLP